jgi:hypothetical protein
MNKRKYSTYSSLLTALRRAGIEKPGVVATLFLQVFLEDNGKLYKETCVERGLCADGKFKVWRDSMVKKGWLLYDYNERTYEVHGAGPKLVPWLNKEIAKTKQIATVSDLATKADIKALEAKADLSALETKADRVEVAQLRAELEQKDAVIKVVKEDYFQLERRVARLESNEAITHESMRKLYARANLGEIDPPHFEKLGALTH